MLFPYEEHGLWGNLLGIGLMYLISLVVYFIFKPLMVSFLEKRSEPIETGANISFGEYWQEEFVEDSE